MYNAERHGERHPERERHSDREEPAPRPQGGQPPTREQGAGASAAPGDTGHRPPEGEGTRERGSVVDIAQRRGQVAGQAEEKPTDIAERAREQARSGISTQMDRTGEGLAHVANAVRQTGAQLRNQQQPDFANYAERAADQIDHLSSYLREKDAQDVVREVENVARRQPLLFLGGTFIAGFLGARFLKSSRQPSAEYRRRAPRPKQRHEEREHPHGAEAAGGGAGAHAGAHPGGEAHAAAGAAEREAAGAKKPPEKAGRADAAA